MDAAQTFTYSLGPAEYQRSFAVCNRKQFRSHRLCILICIFFLIAGYLSPEMGIGLIFLGVFILILTLRSIKALNRQKANLPTHQVTMGWDLYETDFAISIYRDGVLTRYIRRQYSDVAAAWQDGDLYSLLVENSLYILPVASVPKNSHLLAAITRKLTVHSPKTKLEKWGSALFWVTIASLFVSAWITMLVPDYYGGYHTQYMYLMWQALPIPITCIILGFVLKKRGFAWKKNVICGIVIAALLLLFGSFTFLFQPVVGNGEGFLARVEQETCLDFPDTEFSNVTNYVTSAPGNDNIFILSDYYGSLSSYDARIMNQQLPTDERWLQGVPYHLLPCIPLNDIRADADFFLLYDASTGIFNTIPTAQGVHTLFYITYSAKYGSLEIVEYEYTCN